MAEHDKEIGAVSGRGKRTSSPAWFGILLAVLIIILLFLLLGGMNMFSGSEGGTTETNDVTAPTTGQ